MEASGSKESDGASGEPLPSAEAEEYFCVPCLEDGQSERAHGYCIDCREYLCADCCTAHAKVTLTKRHVVLDESEMSRRGANKQTAETGDELTDPCPVHADQVLEYYCKSHNAVVCTICSTLHHRACPDVQYIPDIAEGTADSPEYHELRRKLDEVKEQLENRQLENIRERANVVEAGLIHSRSLQACRERMVAKIDRITAETIAMKDEYVDGRMRQLLRVQETRQELQRKVAAAQADIDEKMAAGCESGLYISLNNAKAMAAEGNETIRKMQQELDGDILP